MMLQTMAFAILGYLSGSVLYARVFSKLLKKETMIEDSKDQNPGTANAFTYGGFACGLMTLIGDLLKGFLPVYLYSFYAINHDWNTVSMALVIAAPVLGHAFPLFYRFQGGKGIAVTFGCLLGLLPLWEPFAALAVMFIFFSLILRITPHFYRTLISYLCALLCIAFWVKKVAITWGFALITATVFTRMRISKEEREKMRVKLLWMR